MHKKHLGDSYDLVKRFFAQALGSIATIYADSRFIPDGIRTDYGKLISIDILPENVNHEFALFLDPDTGIYLPDGAQQNTTRSHTSLDDIIKIFGESKPAFLICYDQAFHRKLGLSKAEQRRQKREYLKTKGLESFYYVSHACFLFVATEKDMLQRIASEIRNNGIPPEKLEHGQPNTGDPFQE